MIRSQYRLFGSSSVCLCTEAVVKNSSSLAIHIVGNFLNEYETFLEKHSLSAGTENCSLVRNFALSGKA